MQGNAAYASTQETVADTCVSDDGSAEVTVTISGSLWPVAKSLFQLLALFVHLEQCR